MKSAKASLLILTILVATGTFGYMLIEGWGVLDSFYMTIISITTTGFAEIKPLSPSGRVFTTLLIIGGVGTIAFLGSRIVQSLIENQIMRRRRVSKKVKELEGHYIVCGFGRLGRTVCAELAAMKKPFVVIESGGDKIDLLISLGYLFVHGDATHDDTLVQAGIERARGMIVILPTDAENVYASLSAKVLNPSIYVVARALEDETEKKLKRAGADRIVQPYDIGALRMVHLLVRPGVVDFMDVVAGRQDVDLNLEEIEVGAGSSLVEKTLADSPIRKTLNVIIVAILRKDGTYEYNPNSSAQIMVGDRLIAIGETEKLGDLYKLCR